jgi:DNA-binding NarL/FixJ family response regulator
MQINNKKKIKIVIADDHPLLLNGLKFTLRSDTDLEIVGEAADGITASEMINKYQPDIAILDYDMPRSSGLEVARKIYETGAKVKVIFLTMNNDYKIFNEAVNFGVKGYLLKDSLEDEVLDAVHEVAGGGMYISPELSKYLIKRRNDSENISAKIKYWDLLTPAEIKVLRLIAENKNTETIADELCISKRTIDRHRSNICRKLDIHGHNAIIHFIYKYNDLILAIE